MNCPNCLLEIDLHLSAGTGEIVKEQTGDIGICFDCGQPMTFNGSEMVILDRHSLSAMESLQTFWNWQRWNWKHSIRGN